MDVFYVRFIHRIGPKFMYIKKKQCTHIYTLLILARFVETEKI